MFEKILLSNYLPFDSVFFFGGLVEAFRFAFRSDAYNISGLMKLPLGSNADPFFVGGSPLPLGFGTANNNDDTILSGQEPRDAKDKHNSQREK